jgi:hypothetical protein
MNDDALERSIRMALADNVRDLDDTTLVAPPLRTAGERRSSAAWLAPLAAAAAVLVVFVSLEVFLPTHARHPAAPTEVGAALDGSWRLVSADDDQGPIRLESERPVTLDVPDHGTVRINDGVNATTLTARIGPEVLEARFRGVTFALDGDRSPDRIRLLKVLDSMGPSTSPTTPGRTGYHVRGDQLTLTTPGGVLRLQRVSPATFPPGLVSTPAAAPTSSTSNPPARGESAIAASASASSS